MKEKCIALLILLYIITDFGKKYKKYPRQEFSHIKYYYAFLMSNIIYIICSGILLYSSYNNVYGSGYCLILFMSGIFLQFYYVGDLVKEKKVNLHITYKNIKYMQKITALFIIMLLLMILRAKILRY